MGVLLRTSLEPPSGEGGVLMAIDLPDHVVGQGGR